jgi:hypothetical protein
MLMSIGCAPDTGPAARDVASPKATTASRIALAQKAAANRMVTVSEFLDANPMGWVGRAHNRGLALAYKEIGTHAPRKLCDLFAKIVTGDEIMGADSLRSSKLARRAALGLVLPRASRCSQANLAAGLSNPVNLVRPVAFASRKRSVDDYLSAIESAFDAASSPNEFATAAASITAAAATELSGGDLDNVNAVASTAASSYDYWASNVSSNASAYQSAYGSECEVASTVEECIRATGLRRNPANRRTSDMVVRVASYRKCTYNLSGKDIAHADVGGAIVGILGGPQGVLAGAFLASGAESVWQFGNWLWCAYHQS